MTDIFLRASVLALAWFACINAVASVLAAAAACTVRHPAARSRPWVLLGIRLFPAGLSLFFVGAMFLPAQWALEPIDASETLGLALNGMAVAGAALLMRSAWRAITVGRAGRLVEIDSRPYHDGAGTYVVDTLPGVSLAGILKPRILIGRTITERLSRAELDVAVAHELAHRDAFDNLARWCMLCAPDFLAGSAVASRLEHDWHMAAESRADARAICGDQTRAVHLASALIKVARLSSHPGPGMAVPSWSTLNDSELLEWRVHRLLSGTVPQTDSLPRLSYIGATLAILLLPIVPVVAGPLHRLTESLIAFLP